MGPMTWLIVLFALPVLGLVTIVAGATGLLLGYVLGVITGRVYGVGVGRRLREAQRQLAVIRAAIQEPAARRAQARAATAAATRRAASLHERWPGIAAFDALGDRLKDLDSW